MYVWWSSCTLYLHARQVRVTTGDSGLCCWVCVTPFEHELTPLFVDSAQAHWASFCFRLLWSGFTVSDTSYSRSQQRSNSATSFTGGPKVDDQIQRHWRLSKVGHSDDDQIQRHWLLSKVGHSDDDQIRWHWRLFKVGHSDDDQIQRHAYLE